MWKQVRDGFAEFSAPLEGSLPYMYLDSKGLVTTAIGCQIETPAEAVNTRNLGAPWYVANGETPATGNEAEASDAEVSGAWQAVHDRPELITGHKLAVQVTSIRLTVSGIAALVADTLREHEVALKRTAEFADLDSWPADAQMGLFSMSWAMGPWFAAMRNDGTQSWPSFRAACGALDWRAAANQSVMRDSGLQRRNSATRGLFRNAAFATDTSFPSDQLRIYLGSTMPTLRSGDSDSQLADDVWAVPRPVSYLQGSLDFLGYPCRQTGKFDGETSAAVVDYQKGEMKIVGDKGGGFKADGVVGGNTWGSMGYIVPPG